MALIVEQKVFMLKHYTQAKTELLLLDTGAVGVRNTYTIGRSDNNTFVIDDLFVSRFQCKISCINDKTDYVLVDYGSRNGTIVNGVLIPPNVPVNLEDNYVVQFGAPYIEYTFRNTEERKLRFRGLLRIIPPLLAWRLRAARNVFHPKRMHFELDGDEPPHPKRQVVILD